MSYQITDQDGITRLMPNHAQMLELVEIMYTEKREVFGDVMLTHDSGYSISLHANGTAVLEGPSIEGSRILTELSREDQLTLWIQLASGNLKALLKLEWETL